MFLVRPPILALVAVLLFMPFAVASTVETWTEGVFDAESDELLQAVNATDIAVQAPVGVTGHVDAVASLTTLGTGTAPYTTFLAPTPGRAPPSPPAISA